MSHDRPFLVRERDRPDERAPGRAQAGPVSSTAPGMTPPVPISPDQPWLAPMAGYTDLPFRLLCRRLGAAVAVTEMVSAKGLLFQSGATFRLLDRRDEPGPLVAQLFGAEPDLLGRAVDRLAREGYDLFDLNCGCSVRKVVSSGAGAALLSDPDRLVAATRAMSASAGAGRVGVKLRLGPKPPDMTCLDLPARLAEAGAGWLTLHPRHASQGFSGRADWSALARFVAASPLPVLASGDIFRAEDARRCLAETGAAGVMFARGALADPSVFARFLDHGQGWRPDRVALAHAELARRYGDERRALLRMRSTAPRYFRELPGIKALRDRLCRVESWSELEDIVARAGDAFRAGKED